MFFPITDFGKLQKEIPYYTRKLPENEDDPVISEEDLLQDEIKFLKIYLEKRIEQLDALQDSEK